MNAITFEELDGLTGELLPERAVLSTAGSTALALGDGGHNGAVSTSGCQDVRTDGTPGLVGALGLGSNNPSSGVACTPASTSVF